MPAAFDALEETADVVDLEALPEAEIRRLDAEGRGRLMVAALEAGTQGVVHDDLHRPTAPAHLTFDADGDVVIEGQRRSRTHIMKSSHHAS